MALSIRDGQADRWARELAEATGESITTAVANAVRERLERETGRAPQNDLVAGLTAIAQRSAALPVHDARVAEAVVGYDEHGLPT